jgi:hypothetical protein
MRVEVKEGTGIIGTEVFVSIQDSLLLKAVVEALSTIKSGQRIYDVDMRAIKDATTVINKIAGETISLNEASIALFDTVVETPNLQEP